MRHTLIALATLSLLAPGAPTALAQDAAPSGQPGEFYAEYTGSVYFLQVADISVSARLEAGTYSASASFQSAGLLRWFDDTDIQASSIGYRTPAGLAPYRYEHVNEANDKGRLVGIDFPDGLATPDINPPFGSMGEPPASDEERAGALDPVVVILNLMLGPIDPGDQELCSGRLPIFDGKARYDLRFENLGSDDVRTRAYRGPAIRCQAYVEPISGYDPGDRPTPEDIARPVNIWLVEIDGVHIPVRFRAATQIGNISIEARRISVDGEIQ